MSYVGGRGRRVLFCIGIVGTDFVVDVREDVSCREGWGWVEVFSGWGGVECGSAFAFLVIFGEFFGL